MFSRDVLPAAALTAVLAFSAVCSRPPIPPDETRYLAVAWEMRLTGDFLVSHLNGETYAHKPPLLFWLINAVWFVLGGASELAARLVVPAASVMSIFLTGALAVRLWPDRPLVHRAAPLVQTSMMLWMFVSPLTMFDCLLTVWAQVGLLGILIAAGDSSVGRASSAKRVSSDDGGALYEETSKGKSLFPGMCLLAFAVGLGILTKGPVILLHVLPAAVLAPVWSGRVRRQKRRWYLSLFPAVLGGGVIGLAWAVPSAMRGGPAYADELLWGQTAGRVVNSFAHQEPFWWYVPLIPLTMLPWLFILPVRRTLPDILRTPGGRCCVCWAGATLLTLSAVSGKQIHYIVPSLPALALLWAAAVSELDVIRRSDMRLIAVGTILAGVTPLLLNHISALRITNLAEVIPDVAALPLVGLGAVLLVPAQWQPIHGIRAISAAAVLFVAVVVVSLTDGLWADFDLRPTADFVHQLQDSSVPVGWYGRSHGQLNFTGRMTQFVDDVTDTDEWLDRFPNGCLICFGVNNLALQPYDLPLTDQAQETILNSVNASRAFAARHDAVEILHADIVRRGLNRGLLTVLQFRRASSAVPDAAPSGDP